MALPIAVEPMMIVHHHIKTGMQEEGMSVGMEERLLVCFHTLGCRMIRRPKYIRMSKRHILSVLWAFKAQSDGITWEKESLITELRKELRVSDEEHRELLRIVNAEDIIRRISQLMMEHPAPLYQLLARGRLLSQYHLCLWAPHRLLHTHYHLPNHHHLLPKGELHQALRARSKNQVSHCLVHRQ